MDSSYIVEFQSEGAGPPTEQRLRSMLKNALRAHGLRCTNIKSRRDDDGIPWRRCIVCSRPDTQRTLVGITSTTEGLKLTEAPCSRRDWICTNCLREIRGIPEEVVERFVAPT